MTLAASGLCTLGGAWGWADQPKATQCKRGLVRQVNISQSTLQIAKRSGKPTGTFVFDGSTVFLDHGVPVSAKDLKPGNHASVYYLTQNGQQVATEVVLHGSGTSNVQWNA